MTYLLWELMALSRNGSEHIESTGNSGHMSMTFCLMKAGAPQESVLDPILFLIYPVELHYVLESLGVFYRCYADDTKAKNKLGVIFNKVDQWMRSG